jgi:hypothetical protein
MGWPRVGPDLGYPTLGNNSGESGGCGLGPFYHTINRVPE